MVVKKEFLYLTKQDVMDVGFTMQETLDVLDEIYHEKAKGNYELPPKIGIHPRPNDYIHAMPCWAHKWEAAGIKWCGGFTRNPQDYGLDYINGVIMMNDAETGVPYSIMDAAWITAQRTGGKSGLAAKYLTRKNGTTVAMLACGVQARKGLEAIYIACPNIRKAVCWDYFPAAAEKFVADMRKVCPDMEFEVAASVREALQDADIIHTAAPTVANDISVVEADMIKPGVLVTSMDMDMLFKKDAIDQFDRFYSDDVRQYCHFRDHVPNSVKHITAQPVELCDMVAGKIPGRISDTENLFAANWGNAFDDMPVAKAIYERAMEMGIGRILPL